MEIKYAGESLTAGFTMRGANTDPNRPPEPPKRDNEPQLYRDTKYPTMVQNGLSGGGGPPGGGGNQSFGGSDNTPSVSRPFNYERHANFLWGNHSDYPAAGNNSRSMPWDRTYTDHVIDRMQPSDARYPSSGTPHEGRSIPPRYIEKTIAYGDLHVDAKGRQTYISGDLHVGVTNNEQVVNHVKYTRGLVKW